MIVMSAIGIAIIIVLDKLSDNIEIIRIAGTVWLATSIVGILLSLTIWLIVCFDEGRGFLLLWGWMTVGMIPFIMWILTVVPKSYNCLKTRRSEKKLKTQLSVKKLKVVEVEKPLVVVERPHKINNKNQIIQELLTLKNKIKALPRQYPAEGVIFGSGVKVAQEQIPIICQVIDDVIRALNTGLDIHNIPISIPQIANSLKKLINEVRKPKFAGTLTVVLNGSGFQRFDNCIYDLEQIANNLSNKDSESDSDFVLFRSV